MEFMHSPDEFTQLTDILDVCVPVFSQRLIKDSWRFTNYPPETATRTSHCGPLSARIATELQQHGIKSVFACADIRDLRRNDRHGQSRHVVCLAELDSGRYIIDATYSQFFAQFGLDHRHMIHEESAYPGELYLVIKEDEVAAAADWAANIVRLFWQNSGYTMGFQLGYQYTLPETERLKFPATIRNQPTHAEVSSFFENLWDLRRYSVKAVSEKLLSDVPEFSDSAIS